MKEEPLLLDVFRAYYDARKHKRNTHSQLEFEFNLEENLVKLYEELRDRTYKVGRSVCFITGNSVKREVFAAHFRDRVVHHLLYNYTARFLNAPSSRTATRAAKVWERSTACSVLNIICVLARTTGNVAAMC